MQLTAEILNEILVSNKIITAAQYKKAVDEARLAERPIEDVLIDQGLLTDENLGKLVADYLEYKYADLPHREIAADLVRLIPETVARRQLAVVFDKNKEGLKVAMHDPENFEFLKFLEMKLQQPISVFYATKNELDNVFSTYKSDLKGKIEEIISKAKDESLPEEERESAIVEIVDNLITYAYQNGASDLHLEPQEKAVLIRFRVDGILHDIVKIPRVFLNSLVTRIKILSKLRTDEHRAAQDGRIRFQMDSDKLDIRVSIIPIIYGEKVVMRLLSEKGKKFSLREIGLQDNDLEKVERAIAAPHGMILVTGPTGSGKTTSMYAMLKILNSREVNIATIEDPIEYDIEGVNQIQVNPRTNLTFSKGLRSIVRQDPDIIMVGEIRDEETADIAVNAALTGHLVLSSLHTNDAATTLPRLIDMNVEPFLVASTVNVIVAQRLVRKICRNCLMSTKLEKNQIQLIKQNQAIMDILKKSKKKVENLQVYIGKGCAVCGQTGYQGRIGIFEVMEISDSLRSLIIAKASADQVRTVAVKENKMTTLLDDGLNKVFNGLTTIEEVLRVVID